MPLPHWELTRQILDACFETINELGPGFVESVYQNALLIALQQKGLAAQAHVPLTVIFRGQVVGEFVADIVVEGQVIVELKAVRQLAPEHIAQTINYLNASGIEVGLLVNFGNSRLEWRRLRRGEGSRRTRVYKDVQDDQDGQQ